MNPVKPTYNYSIPIQYSDNTEYRECFRQVFSINTEKILTHLKSIYSDFDTFEDETKDELMFDENQVNDVMCHIMDNTADYAPFREIYKKAAALMISQDLDIGLSILLSYDYFQEFHAVLAEWFCRPDDMDPAVFAETSEAFQKLRNRLYKK